MASTLEIGDFTYSAGKLDAMKQFHVVRRLGTVLTSVADAMKDKGDGGNTLLAFATIAKAIGEMSDADSEYVIGTCLSVVTRQQAGGTGWAQVWNSGAKRPQFADIDMPAMLQLVWHVLQENLSGFFSASPAMLAGVIPQP